MQISKVSEVTSAEGCADESGDHVPEFRTASELFDLMTKNTHFDSADGYSLSAEDLVLLYQNIDIGTRLMNNASESTIKKPNQYVETIVYNDEHESGSDCSEIFTSNDVNDFYAVNQERLDFFNDKSLENLLCPKLGGFQMHASNLSFDYDKSFLFRDPLIKNQLQDLSLMGCSSRFDNLFSTSLIDYICCKRLEDNYNFYMDNIIRYVQNTIEQLKRISNGDYLTERTKEKWMEVNSSPQQKDNTKVLAMSTSIPLHVECKANGIATWDDIVHSEVDVRSLSKILEKKIVFEIPKLICGSYRLCSKQCADNLIISYQKKHRKIEKEGRESRVDVVFQLQKSQTGQVMSNISSIIVLKTTPALPDIRGKENFPLPHETESNKDLIKNTEEQEVKDAKEPTVTVIQMIRAPEAIDVVPHQPTIHGTGVFDTVVEEILRDDIDDYQDSQNESSNGGTNDYPFSDRKASYASIQYSSESSLVIKDTDDRPVFPLDTVEEKTYNLITPDELHMTMRKLNMHNSTINETSDETVSQCTSKRRSPVRVRIKSPYENKSFLIEEKKRKRLLEIRARREKKKIALSENCKIYKHKYVKGAILPQASSSVTKLSITNKSFYNSIYGHNASADNKPRLRKALKGNLEVSSTIDETQENYFESPMLSPDKNSKKYINRSYYLDDAETEMMYMEMKKKENKHSLNPCSASDSNVSNEFNESLEILQELMAPSETNLADDPKCITAAKFHGLPNTSYGEGNSLLPIAEIVVPINTIATTQQTSKKNPNDQCRKSIDQLYDLINKFGLPNAPTDLEVAKNKPATNINLNEAQTVQGSESGTSVKHIKAANSDNPGRSNMLNSKLKLNKAQSTRTPKVMINSKAQSAKIPTKQQEVDKMKNDRSRRTLTSPPFKGPLPDNPLKAISQLLHEFDNVQKNRQKLSTDGKLAKKVENSGNDVKTYSRQGSYRRNSRIDQHLKDKEQEQKKVSSHNSNSKDTQPLARQRIRPMTPLELARTPYKQLVTEDKNLDRNPQKKITDIIDEVKEARGEAVRGPSKNNSRLNSLAQPKKSYVQAHHEEYQNRYGKNVLAERLQKLVTTPTPVTTVERNSVSPTSSNRNKWKKSSPEAATASVKQRAPSMQQLDQHKAIKIMRKRRSASSSPENTTRVAPAGLKHTTPIEVSDAVSKMVAVESYVHNHYGSTTKSDEPTAGLRCRVPFLPKDIINLSMTSSPHADEDGSVDTRQHMPESSVINAPVRSAVANSTRSESDYCIDILEDCHVKTAVGTLRAESCSSQGHHLNSKAEMEQLETALYSHISGSFQKRLRIKNLTLTPKPSMPQVFLLQSGDAGSMVVKSVSTQNLKKNSIDNLHRLKAIPVLSNSHLDWTFAQLPVQIATVGYAFPDRLQHNTGSKTRFVDTASSALTDSAVQKFCQSSQCLRGLSPRSVQDSSAQVDVTQVTEFVTVSVGNVNNHGMSSQVLPIEQDEATEDKHCVSFMAVSEVEGGNECDADKPVEKTESVYKKETKMKENDPVTKPEHSSTSSPTAQDPLNYTTSLDILVGLLTEIQKITCQNQMVTSDHKLSSDTNLTNDATTAKKIKNTISISSLENLRELESNTSIYSYYVSNFEESISSFKPVLELKRNSRFTEDSMDVQPVASEGVIKESVAVGVSKPTVVDKEVSTCLGEDHADVGTSVSSFVALTSVDANFSASLSSHSTLAIKCHTLDLSLTGTKANKNSIELPQIETRERRVLTHRDKTDLNKKCFNLSIRNVENVKKESHIARSELRYCVRHIDLDPMFKIKRDILVSVYSILVLTVFAALSFPELLFQ